MSGKKQVEVTLADEEKHTQAHFWSANQHRFIEWCALSSFEQVPPTQKLLAAELGVNQHTLVKWKKLPGFNEEVDRRIRENLRDALPDAIGALKSESKKGSYQHLKMYLEMLGWFKSESEGNTLNIKIEYVNSNTPATAPAPGATEDKE